MQTTLIRQNRLEMTPETASSVHLDDAGAVAMTVRDAQLLLDPAPGGIRLHGLNVPLAPEILTSLGWRSGDVVVMEAAGGSLVVSRVADPSDPALTIDGADGAPLPPHWLVQTVSTGPAMESFMQSGHRVGSLWGELIREHLAGAERPAVMDFGCGCGRVARVLSQYVPCDLVGCDLTDAAIEWCERNLPGRYYVSAENPPLPEADQSFDVLYAISVLTHLDAAHQDVWLAEWQRLVRADGLLLVTYRGDSFLSKVGERQREKIERLWEATGMGFTTTDYWEGIFPGFYGGAYHTDAYVREHWGQFFEVVDLRPSTETGMVQDVAVMRRRR